MKLFTVVVPPAPATKCAVILQPPKKNARGKVNTYMYTTQTELHRPRPGKHGIAKTCNKICTKRTHSVAT